MNQISNIAARFTDASRNTKDKYRNSIHLGSAQIGARPAIQCGPDNTRFFGSGLPCIQQLLCLEPSKAVDGQMPSRKQALSSPPPGFTPAPRDPPFQHAAREVVDVVSGAPLAL